MIFDSGITAAALTAVLLNIVFNIVGRKGDGEAPIFAESPAPATISDADEARLDPRSPAARGVHEAGQARTLDPRLESQSARGSGSGSELHLRARPRRAAGTPAAGVAVRLTDAAGSLIAEALTDADGRVGDLGPDRLEPGVYQVTFGSGDYFAARRVARSTPRWWCGSRSRPTRRTTTSPSC